MMSLTHRQAELLAFIERYQAENNGVSPNFNEMQAAIGITSRSALHERLKGLEERGRIRRLFARRRAIEVLSEPVELPPLAHFPSHMLVAELARRSQDRRAA